MCQRDDWVRLGITEQGGGMSMKSMGLVSWMVDLTQLVSVNLLSVSRLGDPAEPLRGCYASLDTAVRFTAGVVMRSMRYCMYKYI